MQRLGILTKFVPDRLAGSGMGYGMLMLVGVFTSVHCVAMCGGIQLSQNLSSGYEDGGKGYSLLSALFYNAGRVISYTMIGFLLGLAGMLLGGGSGAGIPILLQGMLKIFAGIVMVIMGVNMLGIFPWLRRFTLPLPGKAVLAIGMRKRTERRPLIVGLLNGLMPCGPLQSVQILALAAGNPIVGAASMCAFSLGTVPLMLGLGTLVSALGKKFSAAVTGIGAVLVTVLGLSMVTQGGSLSGMISPDRLLFLVVLFAAAGIAASVPVHGRVYRWVILGVSVFSVLAVGAVIQSFDAEEAPVGSTVRVVDGVQLVDSTLSPGSYPNIMVESNIPVKWTIHAPEGSVNGCNYKVMIPQYGLEHIFEEGENVIEFTPTDTGSFSYSCWMGMIQGNITVTE